MSIRTQLHLHNADNVRIMTKWDNIPSRLPEDYAVIEITNNGETLTVFADRKIARILADKISSLFS